MGVTANFSWKSAGIDETVPTSLFRTTRAAPGRKFWTLRETPCKLDRDETIEVVETSLHDDTEHTQAPGPPCCSHIFWLRSEASDVQHVGHLPSTCGNRIAVISALVNAVR